MNLATIIDSHPDDAVAVISRGKPTTFGRLREQVAHLRGGLVGLGIGAGDRVAIAAANNWYFVASYLAALGVGAVVVPLNPVSPAREMEKELASVGAAALIVGPSGKAAANQLDRASLPALRHVVASVGGDVTDSTALDDLLAADPAPLLERADDDLAVLMFTSGTAGSPKAAMLTHGNLLSNLEQCQAHPGRAQGPDDVVLGVLPFFHIFGLNVVLNLSLSTGATTLLIERFDPQSALEAVTRHGVTVISGVPTMWSAWASLPGASPDSFSTVRLATSGAAKLDELTRRAMADRFSVDLVEGYGLTEASPVVTTALGMAGAPDGSIGVPVPGVDVRLVDADGQEALVGDPGELRVRGPNVFAGYWEDPDATRDALTDDGWLRTGDLAVVDERGFVFLVDRAKDLIIVSGFNVYPAEVEDVIRLHPAVKAVAVVGVPHPHTGEAVKAYVVVEDGSSVEEDDIIRHAEGYLARYKCPQKVMFVDEIPQGATGKVLRSALR